MWAQYGFFDPGNPDCVVCPDAVIADAGLTGVQLSPPALRRALSSRFWDKHPTVVSDGLESDAASEGRAEVVLASLVEQFGWKSMRAFRETRRRGTPGGLFSACACRRRWADTPVMAARSQ